VLEPPSPKFQDQLFILPVDSSLKLTDRGLSPLVLFALNLAKGGASPTIIYPVFVSVSVPPGPVTVRDTVNVPVDAYV